MENIKVTKNINFKKIYKLQNTLIIVFILLSYIIRGAIIAKASAAGVDTSGFDMAIDWMAEWMKKIGAVVAFFGGIQFAWGFKSDNPDAKDSGLKTMAAGFMIVGIAMSKNVFGL